VAELKLGGSVGWVQPEHPAKVRVGFAVPLQSSKNGAAEHQELGLIGRLPESLGEHINCLPGLLQPIQQSGEMQPAFDVSRLHLEQLAIGADCLAGKRARSQLVSLLEALLGDTAVAGRAGLVDG
jgi:hypothetical protein